MDSRTFGLALFAVIISGTGVLAQIPERVTFQPSSYGGAGAPTPYVMRYQMLVPAPMPESQPVGETTPAADSAKDAAEATTSQEEKEKSVSSEDEGFGAAWQKKYPGPKQAPSNAPVPVPMAAVMPIPYLAYHTTMDGRTHIVPYGPGYLFASDEMPRRQSHWKTFWSSHPSTTQDQKQVWYLDYYSAMPPVLENEPNWWGRAVGPSRPLWGPLPAASWIGGLPAAALAKVTMHFYEDPCQSGRRHDPSQCERCRQRMQREKTAKEKTEYAQPTGKRTVETDVIILEDKPIGDIAPPKQITVKGGTTQVTPTEAEAAPKDPMMKMPEPTSSGTPLFQEDPFQ